MIEAIKQFAINSGGGNVLIIVQDPLAVRSQPHPLIDLAQRLSSVFQLRTPIEADDCNIHRLILSMTAMAICSGSKATI